MKRIVAFAVIALLVLLVPWERLFSPRYDMEDVAINSFEDIPGVDQPELRRQKGMNEAVPRFVFAQSDEDIANEIERLAEKYSTDKIKIVEVDCIPDHLLVAEGGRASNIFTVEYTVEITPAKPGDGILDEAEEWRMSCGGLRDEWVYTLTVYHEKFKFVNTENGRSISMESSYGNRLNRHQFVPELAKNEQKAFNLVNKFINREEKIMGKSYINFILQRLGIENNELLVQMKSSLQGVEKDELDKLIGELADDLKSNKSVREYMGEAERIKILVETQSDDMEYIFDA